MLRGKPTEMQTSNTAYIHTYVVLFLRSSSPGCRSCEWTPPRSALELMKRDAARTKTSPHLGADTRLPFSFEVESQAANLQ